MTRYFVDQAGKYLGAFDGEGVQIPTNGLEVPNPPENASQTWDGTTWSVVDQNALDLANLNATLIEPGSVVRALGLVTFQEINKLRVKAGLTAYTMDQFITALKSNMR